MARRYYSSTAARTTLATGVDDTTTTLSVTAVSGWPSSFPYTLIIDADTVNEEIVSVSARSGTTLTVTRGVDGTSAVAHSSGAAVQHGVSARDFDEPNAFINGTGTVTETLLASGSVTEAKLGDGAVTSAKIFDGTIVNADINASAAIAQSKIDNLTSDLASKLDKAGGKVLQIVSATHSTVTNTTSTSYVTTSITASITPSSASNKVLVLAQVPTRKVSANIFSGALVALFRGTVAGTNLAANEIYSDTQTFSTVTFARIDSPNTTSAQAYTIGLKTNSASTTVETCPSSSPDASIILIEVSA